MSKEILYDEDAVAAAISGALEEFYAALVKTMDALTIVRVMKRKNPYLYRAKGVQSAAEIVESVLAATVSSSEETVFGNCFFEPLAIAASRGNKSVSEGIDVEIHDKATNTITVVAVKSGTAVYNADSKKKQEDNFARASKLAGQSKARYVAIVGYAYGRKRSSGKGKAKIYEEMAGQAFWRELTGDDEFYLKIIRFMGKQPERYVAEFRESYTKASNRLLREFALNFCKKDGSIDWERLVRFNSSETAPKVKKGVVVFPEDAE